MSHYSKLMLWAAIAVEIAYIGFFISMTDSFALGARSPMFMTCAVLGFLAVVAIIITLQQVSSKPAPRQMPDEREQIVDSAAEQVGGRVLEAGVFVVIALTIYETAAGPNTLGSYSLVRPEALVFALITISAIAGVSRLLLSVIKDQRV